MIRRTALLVCLAALPCGDPAIARAAEAKAPEAAPPAAALAPVASAPANDAQTFCRNVASAAAAARLALQTRKLNDLEKDVGVRVAALEAKAAEVKELLARRDEALRQAQASLVAIYGRMRPEVAAQQIAALDDTTAAALLQGLSARQSSAILNEIPTERAIKLVAAIQALMRPEGKS